MKPAMNKISKLDVANNPSDRQEAVKQLLQQNNNTAINDEMVRLSVDVKKSTRKALKKYVADNEQFKTIGALVEHLIEVELGIRDNSPLLKV